MATTPAPSPAPAPSMDAFSRMGGALFNPKPTFEDIARSPSWLMPMIVICILSVVIVFIYGQRAGWRNFMEKQFAQSSRTANMPADQREQALDRAVKIAPIQGYIFSVVGPFIGLLVVAGVMLGLFNVGAGAGVSFKTSMGITSYAFMPGVIHGLLSILIMYVKDPETLDVQNLVASNVGALLSNDSPKWLQSLGASLDVFSFWTMCLLALGFSVAAPKKVTFGKGLGLVIGIWLVWVLIKVGLSAVF